MCRFSLSCLVCGKEEAETNEQDSESVRHAFLVSDGGGMIRSGWSKDQPEREQNYFFAGSSQGTIGIKFVEGLASGDAKRTAMAPRSAPVREWVTSG
ncbi:hypothetical protein NITLEN_50059 [Nitrospira lenta]|uniref:Uncharacterized protein n=1 Tax=Nitrospira lenta TaxID=1436998 RepID=A0A330LA88_9BACT|nr:hypothetical protein NITLEN_50059 [Nitrospira lenta]